MNNAPNKTVRCLVVGSAHVDVFADIDETYADAVDRRGSISVAVGGTAFNVAVNLLSLGIEVTLITELKKQSLFTRIILSRLDDLAMARDGIILSSSIGEAGFVAHRSNGDLSKAVTSTPIETTVIQGDHYRDLAASSDFIVVDLNNSLGTIQSFLALLKPIYIMAVSEPKALKLLTISGWDPDLTENIRGIFLNRLEAANILQNKGCKKEQVEMLSSVLPTVWAVTKDKDGVVIVSPRGEILIDQDALPVGPVVSSFSGAGDAFASGFLSASYRSQVDLAGILRFALEYTVKSLESLHSNSLPANIVDNVDSFIFRDGLTQLYNRRFFDEERSHIELSLRRRSNDSIAVAMFDIDNFKKVNDTYGHDVGDFVIKKLAEVIKANIRDHDIAIRFGGEEFVVIFHNTDEKTAFTIADRIRKRFSESEVKKNGHYLLNTISGGVAIYDKRFEGLDAAVKGADESLYKSKQSGKNQITIY